MTKNKKAFKWAAITETAVCELCHIRFVFKDIVRHVKSNLNDIALKLLFKTPNEAVVESMGSMLQKHMKPERNAKKTACTA